jgi:hypothetical protein
MQLADDSDDVPALRNKKYRRFLLSKDEWEQLKLLHEVMKVSPASIHALSACSTDTELSADFW